MTANKVRSQENPSSDILLSNLFHWRRILNVPVTELLEQADGDLSPPVRLRACLVRAMKTVRSMQEVARQPSMRRLADNLAAQLIESCPNSKRPWPGRSSDRGGCGATSGKHSFAASRWAASSRIANWQSSLESPRAAIAGGEQQLPRTDSPQCWATAAVPGALTSQELAPNWKFVSRGVEVGGIGEPGAYPSAVAMGSLGPDRTCGFEEAVWAGNKQNPTRRRQTNRRVPAMPVRGARCLALGQLSGGGPDRDGHRGGL